MPAAKKFGILRHVHYFDELGPCNLQAAARCEVLGVASDPKRVESEARGEGQQQPQRSGGVTVAAMRFVDAIANVSGVLFDLRCMAEPQINGAQFFAGKGVYHAEVICGHTMDRMGCETRKLQLKIAVHQDARMAWRATLRHVSFI